MRPNVLLPFFSILDKSRSSLDTYTRVEEEFASLPVQVALKPVRCKVKKKLKPPYCKFLTNSLSLSLSRKRFRKKSPYTIRVIANFSSMRVTCQFSFPFWSLTSPSTLPPPPSLSSRLISASPFFNLLFPYCGPRVYSFQLLISGRVSLFFIVVIRFEDSNERQ